MTMASPVRVSCEARRMLEAWRQRDFGALQRGHAKTVTETPENLSSMEQECLELLDGVAEDMQAVTVTLEQRRRVAPGRIGACLKLLTHLHLLRG